MKIIDLQKYFNISVRAYRKKCDKLGNSIQQICTVGFSQTLLFSTRPVRFTKIEYRNGSLSVQ